VQQTALPLAIMKILRNIGQLTEDNFSIDAMFIHIIVIMARAS
jgi:hypothetical protein